MMKLVWIGVAACLLVMVLRVLGAERINDPMSVEEVAPVAATVEHQDSDKAAADRQPLLNAPVGDAQQAGTSGDPRYERILKCEVALKNRLDDPDSAEFPIYNGRPSAWFADTNTAGEPIETVQFRAKNRFGGKQRVAGQCTYDDVGDVMLAEVVP